MSRAGYSDDCDSWALIRWRGPLSSSIRGKRGQLFLRDMLSALDAMPGNRLIREAVVLEIMLMNDDGFGETSKPDHLWKQMRSWIFKNSIEELEQRKNLRETLFHGFTGCSNGSCIVNDNGRGMRTNGRCGCFVDMSRAQLQIVQGRLQAILYNPISVQD